VTPKFSLNSIFVPKESWKCCNTDVALAYYSFVKGLKDFGEGTMFLFCKTKGLLNPCFAYEDLCAKC